MNTRTANEIIAGFVHNWGEGKRFTIEVESKSDQVATSLMGWLHQTGLSDKEKVVLFDKLRPTAIYSKDGAEQVIQFRSMARLLLTTLFEAIQRNDIRTSTTIIKTLEDIISDTRYDKEWYDSKKELIETSIKRNTN